MEALINDHQSQDSDVLLMQGPSITAYRSLVKHSAWRLYRPRVGNDTVRFRSLIYINRRLSTSSHRQMPCNHPDLTAVKIWSADTQVLIFSVYIPPVPVHMLEEASARTILAAIQKTIQDTPQDSSRATDLILSGDFNRHHPAWGGNCIQPRFIEDASQLDSRIERTKLVRNGFGIHLSHYSIYVLDIALMSYHFLVWPAKAGKARYCLWAL